MSKESHDMIEKLFDKYKDNDYMLQRLYNHINVHLPNTLDIEEINHEKRKNLNNFLSEEQQIFIQVFLSKNNYYYLPNNSMYYEYNGKDYLTIREDDIIHKLLSSISKDRTLLQWKHKTKINIIKQIKERNLFTSTPETDTIQSVLNALYPTFFASKSSAKYFLTILGDNILKKQNDNIFIVSNKMRQLLDELENIAMLSVGNNTIANKFVTRYHETHTFTNYRLIKINENFSQEYWRDLLKRIGLNLICVAVHYSNRYLSSDNFLYTKSDDDLVNYVYMLKNTGETGLINKFINEYIEKTNDGSKIKWKDIHFIWKQFLSNYDLPNVIFSDKLKDTLKMSINYEEDQDSFVGITSKHLPAHKDFINFWNATITQVTNVNFENELEIDEISQLFKLWSKNKSILSEENMVKIIKHFFIPEVVEDKYVLNVTSTQWNKFNDIETSIPYVKSQIMTNNKLSLISFDDIYNYYQKHCRENSQKFVVSKRYFEKYLYYKFSDYIEYERFLKVDWVSIL